MPTKKLDSSRSRTMQAVKGWDTGPEIAIRRLVHSMGFRYRLYRSDLPGKPDLAFSSQRKLIFVHGCFWHGHHCERGNRRPKANSSYWNAKPDRNIVRDAKNLQKLRRLGWRVLVVWECQMKDEKKLRSRIAKFLA